MAETKAEELKHVGATDARSAEKTGRMRYVLGISVPLAVIALFIVWLIW